MSIRRIAIVLLAVAGGWLVITGAQNWLDRRAALAVIDQFLTAVRDGDRDAALAHLEVDRRAEVDAVFQTSGEGAWLAMPGIRWRVNEIDIDRGSARAKLFIEKDGFILEPILHLVRTSTSSWKIDRIEKLQIDPRWNDLKREISRAEADDTAHKLREALNGKSGISVERSTPKTGDGNSP